MKRITLAVMLGCAALVAHADDKPLTGQQSKMKTCNAEAKGKTGDERKAFMKECLSAKKADAGVAASPACEKSAADKKLKGAAARSHIKKCMADGAAAPAT